MRGDSLKFIQQALGRRSQDFMNFVNLINLIIPRKKWKKADYLKHHTPHPPNIHLIIVIPVCHQAFRRSVPSSWDILGDYKYIREKLQGGFEYILLLEPKSASLIVLSLSSIFSGFMSRCILYGKFLFYRYGLLLWESGTWKILLFDYLGRFFGL